MPTSWNEITEKTRITLTTDPREAVRGAHVVNTDVWASMGQEEEQEQRARAFKGYMVDDRLMRPADRKAIFLHCLPAHRGEEVSEDVIEGEQSRVWDQAENRLHVQKALMAMLMGNVSGQTSVSGKREKHVTRGILSAAKRTEGTEAQRESNDRYCSTQAHVAL